MTAARCSLRLLVPVVLLLTCSSVTFAQGGGPEPPPQNGGPPPRGDSGHGPGPPPPFSGPGSQNGGPPSFMRGGLQLGPPGRWWDDEGFSRQLGLRPEQQRRMDSIFNDNRGRLAAGYQGLHQEEQIMDGLSRARNPDEAALAKEIDRIAQARATLEKANTHFLLQLRRELDSDQIARLEEHR